MLIEKASRGTFLGRGHPDTDDQGYALDDPPTQALYNCDWCGAEMDEDELVAFNNEDLCKECGGTE